MYIPTERTIAVEIEFSCFEPYPTYPTNVSVHIFYSYYFAMRFSRSRDSEKFLLTTSVNVTIERPIKRKITN